VRFEYKLFHIAIGLSAKLVPPPAPHILCRTARTTFYLQHSELWEIIYKIVFRPARAFGLASYPRQMQLAFADYPARKWHECKLWFLLYGKLTKWVYFAHTCAPL